jgi:enamine deaminase RidA (YjgF/YER057c/UK114 family)
MSKQIVNPPNLTAPSGYSHGILTDGGRLLFLAGQVGSDATGRIAKPNDLVGQFDQAISNIRTVVEAAGGRATDVVKLNVFVRSRDDYVANLKPLGAVFRRHFGSYYPAMALFQVSALFDREALVELEGMAVIGD